jgi:hypothetical protein
MYNDRITPFARYMTQLMLGQDLYQKYAEQGKVAPPSTGFLIQNNNDFILQNNGDRILITE